MNRSLTRAVVDALFFGLSDAETIRDDAAVGQLESTAAVLKDLTSSERQEFFEFVREGGDDECRDGNLARAGFLEPLHDDLGLDNG